MRIYKNAWFAKFVRKERIGDAALCDAVDRAVRGLIDADLGGGVIKQRVAREGEGKSGGFRTLILFRHGERAIFAFGFAKNDWDNVSAVEIGGTQGCRKGDAGSYPARDRSSVENRKIARGEA